MMNAADSVRQVLDKTSLRDADLMKALIDMQNSIGCNAHSGEFPLDSPHRKSAFGVPRVATLIKRIALYRGLALVSRQQQLPALGIHL